MQLRAYFPIWLFGIGSAKALDDRCRVATWIAGVHVEMPTKKTVGT